MSSVPLHDEAIFAAPAPDREAKKTPAQSGGASRLINRKRTASKTTDRPPDEEPGTDLPDGNDDGSDEPPSKEGLGSQAELNSFWSSAELDDLLNDDDADLGDYELSEYRDGFCDALFLQPRAVAKDDLLRRAERTLPVAFQKHHPLSLRAFLPRQLHEFKGVVRRVATTRMGIRLARSFVAFFTAYALCLVPWVRAWLGRYSYMIVVSTIINHPGRTVGSQLDGTILTIAGTATGLGWGAFGLWLSTSSAAAMVGFGGILAMFLCLYIAAVAALRSYFIRLYQFVICAGIAVSYTCLADVSGDEVAWPKLLHYGVPWVLGQAICLVTCIICVPDAGARGLAVSLNDAFDAMLDGLNVRKAQKQATRRRLAQTFINLSQAYRDLSIDITLSLFNPRDVLALRNLLQAVVRSLLAMRPEPTLDGSHPAVPDEPAIRASSIFHALVQTTVLATPGLSDVKPGPLLTRVDTKERAVRLVRFQLDEPTKRLLHCMKLSLQSCHAVLMDMSGYRRYLGPPEEVKSDLAGDLVSLRKAMIKFDEAEAALLDGEELTAAFVPEVVELFTYCRPIRQAVTSIEAALVKVNEMQQRRTKWPRLYLPSYPWKKALNRTNAQVRHDRGGLTAASYYKSFADISRLIQKLKSSEYYVMVEEQDLFRPDTQRSEPVYAAVEADRDGKPLLKKSKIRHSVWKVAHRLQGFEMRFALKTAIVTSLLAIPAWIDSSRTWWQEYEAWWAVVIAWIMMHPRVGGNVQDLATRAVMGALGAIWSGAGYAAGNGNPFVMGAFAIIYMVPMLYRFTLSSHPRSGLVGCLSFTVSSLALMANVEGTSPLVTAVGHGVAFVVGVVASVIINWVIWPFVARHELRKALSEMMFFLSIAYRNIIGRYVYYDQGHKPTAEDVERSEVLEGRLREGFVRIRQLMGLTRHEIRLRSPFDPLPYSALCDACDHFFEYLIAVRQSALFFHPRFITDNDEALVRLLNYRRDAVASILTNLYILAGALRANRKVPRYLPSAPAARKRLMVKMAELEAEYEDDRNRDSHQLRERQKWVQIYQYSYNESLTGCVAQLEELERYTKLIVGEQGFDDYVDDPEDSDDERDEK